MTKQKKKNILIALFMVLTVITLVITDSVISRKEKYPEADKVISANALSEGHRLSEYPDELKALLERNPETEDFVVSYPLLRNTETEYDLSEYTPLSSVPHLLQWDKRWGYEDYAGSLMALSGCGPVCLSMVAVYLTGDTALTPSYIAQFAEKNGYAARGNGTKWTLMSEGAGELGLISEELPLHKETMINALNDGKPLILIMGAGDFTTSGHFIVLTEYTEEGFSVLDPNSKERSEKKWSYERIEGQIRNIWAFSVG